jgi:hypothetical protein
MCERGRGDVVGEAEQPAQNESENRLTPVHGETFEGRRPFHTRGS